MLGVCSYFEYAVGPARLRAVRRTYDPAADAFRDQEAFEVALQS